MRRVFLVFIILFSFSTAALGASFADFPEGHWVYQAIGSLSEASILDEEVPVVLNRFEAALMVTRALQQLEQGEAESHTRLGISREILLADVVLAYNRSVDEQYQVCSTGVDWLQRLTHEFRSELAVLGYSVLDSKNGSLPNLNTPGGLDYDPILRENLRRPYLSDSASLWRYSGLSSADEAESSSSVTLAVGPGALDWNGAQAAAVEGPLFSTPKPELPGLESEFSIAGNHYLRLGAHYLDAETGSVESERSAVVSGEYSLGSLLRFAGEYKQPDESAIGTGALSLGATVSLGDVEVGGVFRTQQYTADLGVLDGAGDTASTYELSLRVGDLVVNTALDEVVQRESSQRTVTTSLGLQYSLPNSVLFSAGFSQSNGDLRSIKELGMPSVASVALDLPIPQGRLRVGLSSEFVVGNGNSGLVWAADLDGISGGELVARTTATIGVSYSLTNDASFRLNYKLIDFSGMDSVSDEQQSNLATAEFSIRF